MWLWLIAMVMCYPGADFGGLGLYVDYVFVLVGLVCCVDCCGLWTCVYG